MTPIHQNMKPIVQIVGMALACTCLATGYTCFTIDAANQVNCATAWVDTGTVVGVTTMDGQPVTGVCINTVDKQALRSVSRGKGKTSNVTCDCPCRYVIDGVPGNRTCNLNKYYDKLNDNNCP
jgi:hypothetical protein